MGNDRVPAAHFPNDWDDPRHKQVGGDHYKSLSIQPRDAIKDWGLNWDEGNAVKYIARKGKAANAEERIVDIDKAIHYLEMERDDLRRGR